MILRSFNRGVCGSGPGKLIADYIFKLWFTWFGFGFSLIEVNILICLGLLATTPYSWYSLKFSVSLLRI